LTDAQVDALEGILGTAVSRDARPRLIDVGPRWTVAQLSSAQAVLSCRPDLQRLKEQDTRARTTGVVIFGEYEPGAPARIEVRAFAPASGVYEDPVCGSGNGCVAAFIRESGQTSRFGSAFVSSQGMALGRAGLLRVAVGTERIQIGGMSVTCIDGQLSF
jgi:PhzF family phenazine biosynthesis protein